MSALHPESLLHLRLVRQMLEDPHVPQRARAVDRRWAYEKVVPVSVVGFNPYTDAVYHARRSAFASWLVDPAGSARDHNEGDFLVHEVFFAVHDWLHVWSVQLLRELEPGRRLGRGRVDARDLEALTFLHLVTEAAATVGLDYWYLATLDVNEIVPIGTNHGHLATEYRERDLPELRRACPDLEVQTPAFFTRLARFYATGVWDGCDVDGLRRSPKTHRWLRHELAYGALQRRYVRTWLRYLATGEAGDDARADAAPVALDEAWQERVLAEVGEALWRKVKGDGRDGFARRALADDDEPWRSPEGAPPDFRFVNLNALAPEAAEAAAARPYADEAAAFLGYQWLSRHAYEAISPPQRRQLADLAGRRGGLAELRAACRELAPVEADAAVCEPRDLLLLN